VTIGGILAVACILALGFGGLVMLVCGAICLPSTGTPEYCASVGQSGAIAMTVVGALLCLGGCAARSSARTE
jgi:membrane-bound ClpP family serine protease